jgi:hypothetical protein
MTDIVDRLKYAIAAVNGIGGNSPLLATALEEIERLRAASEWRDISTAPRDGTIVDLWLTGGGRMTDQWWDEDDESWCGLDDKMFSHWIIAPVDGPAPPQRNEVTK